MVKKSISSIEEQVEDMAKSQLARANVRVYTKTDSINNEIQSALDKAPSKTGGSGTNYPDIKALITTSKMRHIPVMIEVKGSKGDFIKMDENGDIANSDSSGKPNYANIKKYAVNGAVHYACAIINNTESYNEVIAIGINGYNDVSGQMVLELGVYYVSKDNLLVPKKIDNYNSLAFLSQDNIDELIQKIDNLSLTAEEIELRTLLWENQIEDSLKELNQEMNDTHNISEDYRVKLISGLIMAGLGVKDKVSPLTISDLKGDKGSSSHDGVIIINKISSFLNEKDLPEEKRDMIIEVLRQVFLHSKLHEAINGESRLKKVYNKVYHKIMPFFNSEKYHIDFTGKLFNTLNAWVKVPDGNQNDVVLTPRYVCEMMAELCQVNKDSYVWDYTVGSAGFLIAAMKLMIRDAEEKLSGDPSIRDKKILKIKAEQLMGIEKLPDIYMLAVLNMILVGDGSTNLIHKDSLEFDGTYEQGSHKGQEFPANVFLLNPPYSADGKGLVFVERALKRMKNGRAAVLIQENAGSGKGLPFSKNILTYSSLIASIHMSDIFKGKASVQTAVYIFEVGTPHKVDRLVKFVDFSNDGYTRQNRKKASANTNLKDTDHAVERYNELVAVILGNKRQTNFLDGFVYEDTITLDGNDWTVDKHKKIDPVPKESDFRKTISDYLSWKVSTILRNTENENFQ